MKIAFEVQPLVDNEKTGIPWTTYMIIQSIMNQFRSNEYRLLYFKFRKSKVIPDNINKLKNCSSNCIINKNKCIPYGVYRKIWHWLGLEYSNFFKEKADIYHFFNFVCPPNVQGKVVITVYDMVHKTFSETMTKANYIRLEKELGRSCNQADAIITVSENSKKEIIKYLNVPPEKIHVVYNGIDFSVFHNNYSSVQIKETLKKYAISNSKQYFLYLGTLEPRKNISAIIDAYYRLITNCNSFVPSLVIAGKKGWLFDDLFSKVKKYGIQDRVFFPGYIQDEDVPKLMKGALAFIFPSLYEGFGMPPVEAMACGTPVIVSNTSSLPEVVGDAGILIDPHNTEELSYWMRKLMQDALLRKELTDKGMRWAKSFNWENSAKKIMNIYLNLMFKKD